MHRRLHTPLFDYLENYLVFLVYVIVSPSISYLPFSKPEATLYSHLSLLTWSRMTDKYLKKLIIEWTQSLFCGSCSFTKHSQRKRALSSFPYPAIRSQRDLWNRAHWAPDSSRCRAVTTKRQKFSTLILIFMKWKTLARNSSGDLQFRTWEGRREPVKLAVGVPSTQSCNQTCPLVFHSLLLCFCSMRLMGFHHLVVILGQWNSLLITSY